MANAGRSANSASGSRIQHAGLLPAVRVTDADRREYASIVDESLRETLALYEDFAVRRNRRMDPRRWKLLRAKENARVYRERSASDRSVSGNNSVRESHAASTSASSKAESSSVSGSGGSSVDDEPETFAGLDEPVPSADAQSVEIGPGSSLSVSTKVPVLVTTSVVPGELDDVLYGAFASDASTILRRSLYEKDGMQDAAVLATLGEPSERRPFASLLVVWMLRAFPGVGAALVKQRDFLLLMSTGTTVSPTTGERIGYGVAQSVVHPDLPELRAQQIIRGVMSYCVLYRQLPGQQQVETFIQVVLDPRGAAMTFFIVQETVNSLFGLSSHVDCSLRKKLTWFLLRARDRRRREAARASDSQAGAKPAGSASCSPILADTTASSSSANYSCVRCAKALGSLLGSQGQRCSICLHWACNKCRVSKSLAVRAPSDSKGQPFATRPFSFCLPCFVAAKNYPARQLQIEELTMRRPRGLRSSSSSSSTGGDAASNPDESFADSFASGVTLYQPSKP